MCCFTQPVISVNNTEIFARLSGIGSQFLAYQMSYESQDENAMILPIPVKKTGDGDAVRFIDLENYPDFFENLSSCFPYEAPAGISIGCSMPKTAHVDSALQVFEVGNYIASFVPSIDDFDRLDPKFKFSDQVWDQIPDYKTFGFAVFQLAAGALKPHPMAFEFQTDSDELFFPTLHIHDGEVHDREEFDHVLYMQHAGLDSTAYGYKNSDVEDRSTGLIRSKYRASRRCSIGRSKGLLESELLLHRKIIRGQRTNCDTVISPPGDPMKTSLNFRPLMAYSPWLIPLAAIGWFFNRRSKIKRMTQSKFPESDSEIAE